MSFATQIAIKELKAAVEELKAEISALNEEITALKAGKSSDNLADFVRKKTWPKQTATKPS